MEVLVIKFLLVFFFLTVAHATELKLLSWNVFMLPKPIKKSLQNTRTRVIPELLRNSDYDIMVFQEAFDKKFRRNMIAQLNQKFPHAFYLKRDKKVYHVMGSGVFIMSRHPFKVLDRVYFKKCATADCLAAKAAVLVELSLPNGEKVHVASTHMQSENRYDQVRASQITQIQTMLKRHRQLQVPLILAGDLNIDAVTPRFQLAQDTLEMVSTPLAGDIQYTSGRFNDCYKIAGRTQDWIDHAWVSLETRVKQSRLQVPVYDFLYKGKTCPASDHHAIAAQFEF